jgi:hypothetical protein
VNRDGLVRSLLHYAAAGKLDPRLVQPVLRKLEGEAPAPETLGAMLEALLDQNDPALGPLAGHLREARRKDALAHQGLKSRRQAIPEELRASLGDLPLGAPLGWSVRDGAMSLVQSVLRLLADRFYFAAHRDKAPALAVALDKKVEEAFESLFRNSATWSISGLLGMVGEVERQAATAKLDVSKFLPALQQTIENRRGRWAEASERVLSQPGAMPGPDLDPGVFLAVLSSRYARSEDRIERARLLDIASQWPSDQAAPILMELPRTPWEQDRAAMILTLRFGQPAHTTWESWRTWLRVQTGGKGLSAEGSRLLVSKRPMAMLYLWYSRQSDADRDALAALEQLVAARLEPVTLNDFVERWADSLSPAEMEALTGQPAASVTIVEEPKVVATPRPVLNPYIPAEKKVEPRRVAPPRPPPKPSVWDVHLKPFFLENWYMVAGAAMILVGSSLLAYYTWDKTWLVKYSLMPSLLGVFTATLAWMGGWIERKDAQFKGTAAVLRSAAIGLLPINFMAVAILANDDKVPHRGFLVPVMGLIYLAAFGWGLRRWCSAVHPGLGLTLGGTLLFLNGLVTLAPLAHTLSSTVRFDQLLPVVGTGFYLGFFALVAAVVRFSRRILTAELAKEKRVVWFFGATLAVTFLQVFAWVHGSLHYLPHVQTYAPMVVLTGWLVLFTERRTLELRGAAEKHGAESFLGFAFILLGVLMGIGHQHLRIVTLVLAGLVWLYQSLPRRQALHDWIGLTFLGLGGASVGLLHGFPPTAWPTLGIALALAMGGILLLARSNEGLKQAAAGMQGAVLILTVLVTMLAQQAQGTSPFAAAGHLVAVSALFGVRAWRDRKIRWVQTAMVVLALALPYLAGIDFARHLLHSTTVVFGLAVLSFLWIALTLAARSPILSGARSTVLWIYGALAIGCMSIRGSIDPLAASDAVWLDLGGPLLMVAVMIWASYFSRSLVPAGMAMLIGLILMPELKEHVQKAYPRLGWGTGFGSSLTALALMLGSFFLRRAPALRNLGEGDKYMGETPYPLRRLDSTLFTLPMIASAVFLAAKIETWNLFMNLDQGRLPLMLVLALFVSGVVWTLFAVFHREQRLSVLATLFGLLWMITGIACACPQVVQNADVPTKVLAPAIFVQALYFLYRFAFQPRFAWVRDLLTRPTLWTLRLGSLLLGVACVIAAVFDADPRGSFGTLSCFLAVQLAWHGLKSRRLIFGFVHFALDLSTLLAWTYRVSGGRALLAAALGLVIAVQALQIGLEFRRPFYEYLKPLMVPFQWGAVSLALLIAVGMLGSVRHEPLQALDAALALLALLLSARAISSGPLALLAVLVGYVFLEGDALRVAYAATGYRTDPMSVLALPLKMSFLAFAMAVFGHVGKRIHRMQPLALSGPFTPRLMKWPAVPWMFLPAATLAVLATMQHVGVSELRDSAEQLWTPYVGAATVGLIAFSTGLLPLYHGSGALLTFGNIHLVRIVLGGFLRMRGLSEVHLAGLGIALTLLQGTLVRLAVRKEEISRLIQRSSLVWASLILLLISANYLVHPDLQAIGALRFGISGAMALLAGLYFRRVARHPAPGEESYALGCEGFYHFGVTMAFWCAALMVPPLRHPVTALVALAVPAVYFYARAESGFRRGVETFARYRVSAATLGFVVLALYVFRGAVQLVIFPEARFDTVSYHANSPVIFVLGLMLLRLHALGGSSWLALYGGLAVMASTYFALTALPGLSPFRNPVTAAWCAIGMAHFYTLASAQRSPLRTAIQRLAAIDAQGWQAQRRPWGLCLLAASQAMALYGVLLDEGHMVAPLILGAASVLVHQGILRKSRVYSMLAQAEVALALHVGFLGIPSYLPPAHVVWAILALWAALLALSPLIARLDPGWEMAQHAGIFAALTLAHVFYHGPGSTAGLWAFGLGTVLAALTPRGSRSPRSLGEVVTAAGLPWAPAWLVWFSQSRGWDDLLRPWPALATMAALLATGILALQLQRGWAAQFLQAATLRPRLFDQTIAWLGKTGEGLYRALLGLTFAGTVLIQAAHWNQRFAAHELALLEGLMAAFAVAWVFEGKARKAPAPYFLMEVCVLGAYLAARQQLQLTGELWRNEFDIWASLAAFFGLVGAKQLLDGQPREVQIPFKSTLMALPLFSVAWIVLHSLGTTMGLIVIGLHSAAFTYLGKDDRESPYHLVAIGGFVSFVILLFWSRMHFAMVYAYVIPVGLGVLVLLQLFKARVPEEARNGIRAVTVLSMLGSAGWSALLDRGIPLLDNVILLGLCLGAMGLGGLLRIRMYVALGFGALMIDLLALLVKAVAHLERSLRMTMVGSLVLVVGASLVFGAIYYKTHRKEIGELLDRWRLRFAGWE